MRTLSGSAEPLPYQERKKGTSTTNEYLTCR